MQMVQDTNLQNSSNIPNQSFKQRNSLPERQAAVASIRAKFPNKVPVIVERFKNPELSALQETFGTFCIIRLQTPGAVESE